MRFVNVGEERALIRRRWKFHWCSLAMEKMPELRALLLCVNSSDMWRYRLACRSSSHTHVLVSSEFLRSGSVQTFGNGFRDRAPSTSCTITGLLTAIRLIREALDLQEQFPPIHPKQHEPVAQQNHAAPKEGLQSSAGKLKKVPAQVDLEAAIQKSFHEMRDAVRSNRVHADDNQRERPFLETLYIDHPTESGQEQEADASAEDGPRRRPDAFHHWANVRIMQRQSQRNPRHAGK